MQHIGGGLRGEGVNAYKGMSDSASPQTAKGQNGCKWHVFVSPVPMEARWTRPRGKLAKLLDSGGKKGCLSSAHDLLPISPDEHVASPEIGKATRATAGVVKVPRMSD